MSDQSGGRRWSQRVDQGAGASRVLWFLVTADGPLTAPELADAMDTTANAIYDTLHRLWRAGFLYRRKRSTPGRGGNPHEYVVASRDDHPMLTDDEEATP